MKHVMDKKVAEQYGVNIALLLESFQYWTDKNLTRKKHIHDGLCWSYDTLESLGETFTYWTKRQIEHTINNAVKQGLLVKGNYNQTKYDRTVWYALTPFAYGFYPDLLKEIYLERLHLSISQNCEIDYTNFRNRFPIIVTTIPITSPVTKKPIIISDSDESPDDDNNNQTLENAEDEKGQEGSESPTKSDYQNNQTKICSTSPDIEQHIIKIRLRNNDSQESDYQKIVDAYHEVLPECPKIKVIDRKLKAQLNCMRREWPKYQKEGRAFTIDSFKDYLTYIEQHYSWFLKPYTTESGKRKHNNLRVFTREINISKIVNGEFNAS